MKTCRSEGVCHLEIPRHPQGPYAVSYDMVMVRPTSNLPPQTRSDPVLVGSQGQDEGSEPTAGPRTPTGRQAWMRRAEMRPFRTCPEGTHRHLQFCHSCSARGPISCCINPSHEPPALTALAFSQPPPQLCWEAGGKQCAPGHWHSPSPRVSTLSWKSIYEPPANTTGNFSVCIVGTEI